MLVQPFSRSCLAAVQVCQALFDAELFEFIVDIVESFLIMLRNISLVDTQIRVNYFPSPAYRQCRSAKHCGMQSSEVEVRVGSSTRSREVWHPESSISGVERMVRKGLVASTLEMAIAKGVAAVAAAYAAYTTNTWQHMQQQEGQHQWQQL